MAKTVVRLEPKIYSQEFTGYVSDMPQEAKDALKLRNEKAWKTIFEPVVLEQTATE